VESAVTEGAVVESVEVEVESGIVGEDVVEPVEVGEDVVESSETLLVVEV